MRLSGLRKLGIEKQTGFFGRGCEVFFGKTLHQLGDTFAEGVGIAVDALNALLEDIGFIPLALGFTDVLDHGHRGRGAGLGGETDFPDMPTPGALPAVKVFFSVVDVAGHLLQCLAMLPKRAVHPRNLSAKRFLGLHVMSSDAD